MPRIEVFIEKFTGNTGLITTSTPTYALPIAGTWYRMGYGPKVSGDASNHGFGAFIDFRSASASNMLRLDVGGNPTLAGENSKTVGDLQVCTPGFLTPGGRSVVFGAWCYFGAINAASRLSIGIVEASNATGTRFSLNPSDRHIYIDDDYGGGATDTGLAVPLNGWVYLDFVCLYSGTGGTYNFYVYSKTPGGSYGVAPTSHTIGIGGGVSGSTGSGAGIYFGLARLGGGDTVQMKIGCFTAALITSLSDLADPATRSSTAGSAIIDPLTTPATWYINPATGIDTNDGLDPSTPWKTATQWDTVVNSAFDLGTSNGDTLAIDTRVTPLDLSGGGLNIGTTNVTTPDGFPVRTLAYKRLNAIAAWTLNSGVVYQITTGGSGPNYTSGTASSKIWQDGISFGNSTGANDAATIINVQATAGTYGYISSGATLVAHFLGGLIPSAAHNQDIVASSLKNPAYCVQYIPGGTLNIAGFDPDYVDYDPTNGINGYPISDTPGATVPSGATTIIHGGNYGKHGADKHCFAVLHPSVGGTVEIWDATFGPCDVGGNAIIFYTDVAGSLGTLATRRCRASSTTMAAGTANPIAGGILIDSHDDGTHHGTYASLTIDACDFRASPSVAGTNNQGCLIGNQGTIAAVNVVNGSFVDKVSSAGAVVVSNSTLTQQPAGSAGGSLAVNDSIIQFNIGNTQSTLLYGAVNFDGVTFDLTTGGSTGLAAAFDMTNITSLRMRGCVVIGNGVTALFDNIPAGVTPISDYNEFKGFGTTGSPVNFTKNSSGTAKAARNLLAASRVDGATDQHSIVDGIDAGFSLAVNLTTYQRTAPATSQFNRGPGTDRNGFSYDVNNNLNSIVTFPARNDAGAYQCGTTAGILSESKKSLLSAHSLIP